MNISIDYDNIYNNDANDAHYGDSSLLIDYLREYLYENYNLLKDTASNEYNISLKEALVNYLNIDDRLLSNGYSSNPNSRYYYHQKLLSMVNLYEPNFNDSLVLDTNSSILRDYNSNIDGSTKSTKVMIVPALPDTNYLITTYPIKYDQNNNNIPTEISIGILSSDYPKFTNQVYNLKSFSISDIRNTDYSNIINNNIALYETYSSNDQIQINNDPLNPIYKTNCSNIVIQVPEYVTNILLLQGEYSYYSNNYYSSVTPYSIGSILSDFTNIYKGSLSDVNIKPGSFSISVNGNTIITADGNGGMISNYLSGSSNNINYETGEYSFQLSNNISSNIGSYMVVNYQCYNEDYDAVGITINNNYYNIRLPYKLWRLQSNPWSLNNKFFSYLLDSVITEFSNEDDIYYAQKVNQLVYGNFNYYDIGKYNDRGLLTSSMESNYIEFQNNKKIPYSLGYLDPLTEAIIMKEFNKSEVRNV